MMLSLLSIVASAQDASTYRLQAQDVIRIQIYGEPQVNTVLPIGKDGNISAPFVGIIHAAGRTTSELEAELSQKYEPVLHLKEMHVAVTIEQYRPLRATIGGMVNQPGIYEFKPGDTVLTLISRGGGINVDRADTRRATLKKANSRELIPIDLHAMLLLGDTSQNYAIEDMDELIVPEETTNRILVLGAIQSPGPYPYKEPMHLADAITMAHGPIPTRSMLSRVLITREQPGKPGTYTRISANFVRFIRNGDNAQNILLQPGDLVYISETKTPDINQIVSIISNGLFIFDRFRP